MTTKMPCYTFYRRQPQNATGPNSRFHYHNASLNRFLMIADTCYTIGFVILFCPTWELRNIDANCSNPLKGGCRRAGRIVMSCDLMLLAFLAFIVIDIRCPFEF